jgi:hypothetical protein
MSILAVKGSSSGACLARWIPNIDLREALDILSSAGDERADQALVPDVSRLYNGAA